MLYGWAATIPRVCSAHDNIFSNDQQTFVYAFGLYAAHGVASYRLSRQAAGGFKALLLFLS